MCLLSHKEQPKGRYLWSKRIKSERELKEAMVISITVRDWTDHYNHCLPHSLLWESESSGPAGQPKHKSKQYFSESRVQILFKANGCLGVPPYLSTSWPSSRTFRASTQCACYFSPVLGQNTWAKAAWGHVYFTSQSEGKWSPLWREREAHYLDWP